MKTFNIYTLGCKVNQYDSISLKRKLISSGLGYGEKNADISIVNTCSVTKSAISRNKQMIKKAKKENPEAIILLAGCWPKIYKEEAMEMDVNFVFSVGEEEDIIKMAVNYNPPPKLGVLPVKEERAGRICGGNNYAGDKSRYFIKIQDGCEQFCAYCVVPYARGKLKSVPKDEIINEIEEAVAAGFREVVLSGVHIGLYGKDLEKKTDLAALLKEIIEIKDLGRARISSISVKEVSDEFINLMASTKKICSHLHLSLQSGCDKILKSMNRPYDAEFFRRKVEKIREAMPDIAITTDVIVGFPGETEDDFRATYDFCREMNFSKIHIFPFSAHEKTPAGKMKDKVSAKDISERAKKLGELNRELESAYKKKFAGSELEAVVDNRMSGGKLRGKTEFYFDVIFKAEGDSINPKDVVGKIIKVKNWE